MATMPNMECAKLNGLIEGIHFQSLAERMTRKDVIEIKTTIIISGLWIRNQILFPQNVFPGSKNFI